MASSQLLCASTHLSSHSGDGFDESVDLGLVVIEVMRDANIPAFFELDDHNFDSNLFPKLFLQTTPVPGR